MSTIQLKCVDQTLTLTNTPVIASGGQNEDYVQFEFCPLWDGYIKTAVFWRTPAEARTAILDGTNKALIPAEVLTREGIIYIGAFGTNGTTRRTSEVVRYKVVQGAVSEDIENPDPSPDVWTQILALCADILNKVDDSTAELDAATQSLKEATEALNAAENKLSGTKLGTDQYEDGSVTAAKLAANAVSKSLTVTLTTAGWSSKKQTVTAAGVTTSNTVIVSPAPASFLAYSDARVRCTAQAGNALTFTCEDVPAEALTVNVCCVNK